MIKQIIPALVLSIILFSSECNASFDGSMKIIKASDIMEKIKKGERVCLEDVTIMGDLSTGGMNFSKEEFKKGQNIGFNADKIKSDIIIRHSTIYGDTIFRLSLFEGWVDFTGSQFMGNVDFSNCLFLLPVSFTESRIEGDLDFSMTTFLQSIDCSMAEIQGYTNFYDTEFKEDAVFAQSKFMGNAIFSDTKFYEDADFRYAYLDNVTRFGGLLFPNPLSGFACDWGLLKNRIYTDKADEIYYHYRIWGLNSLYEQGRYLSMAFDILAWLSCGFGVHPEFTVFWSVVLIASFGLSFWRFDGIQMSSNRNLIRKPRAIYRTKKISSKVTVKDALYFSTLVFFSSQPPSYMQPAEKWRWRHAMMIEIILGWVLISLFIVSLGYIMIR